MNLPLLAIEIATLPSPHGEFRVKLGRFNGVVVSASPEYEDVKNLAARSGIPFRTLYADFAARAAALLDGGKP